MQATAAGEGNPACGRSPSPAQCCRGRPIAGHPQTEQPVSAPPAGRAVPAALQIRAGAAPGSQKCRRSFFEPGPRLLLAAGPKTDAPAQAYPAAAEIPPVAASSPPDSD